MQVPIVIGIGLFGLLSLAAKLEGQAVRPSSTSEREQEASSSGVRGDVVLVESGHHWFNLDRSELLGIEGTWEEVHSVQGTTLYPLEEKCALLVGMSWNREVLHFRMPMRGTASIERGWLVIDQESGSKSVRRAFPATPRVVALDCDHTFRSQDISCATASGPCWDITYSSEDQQAGECDVEGGLGCELDIVSIEGASAVTHSFHVECGSELSFVANCTENGTWTVCVTD